MLDHRLLFSPRFTPGNPTLPSHRLATARLALVHAHRAEAELFSYYCRTFWEFEVVAAENHTMCGIETAMREKPEIVLISLPSPELALDALLQRMLGISPATKIVGLLSQCDDYLIHSLTKTACHGLIFTPEESLDGIGQIIARVRRGETASSEKVQRIQRALRLSPTAFPKLLTKRELEVLICVAHAMSDEEIAQQLGFSKASARSHLDHIMQKLDIHKVTKLINWCALKGFTLAPLPAGEKRVEAA